MWTLADILGKYPVGATTFATSLGDGHVVGTSKLKSGTSSGGAPHAPALVLKEVVFTAYYPADVSQTAQGKNPSKGLYWLTSPPKEMLRGYSKFMGLSFFILYWILGGVASRLKIPVYPNARLLNRSRESEDSRKSWPLVFFSHGLGGTRTNYSHFCYRLASQGNVVLAIEHHDGSSPFITVPTHVPGSQTPYSPEYRYYLQPEDAYQEIQSAGDDKLPLRTEQLEFRRLEVYLAYTRFRDLVQKQSSSLADELDTSNLHTVDGPWNFKLKQRSDDSAFWQSWMTESSSPKVRCDESVHLTGHSFGGATVLSILSQPPPSLPGMDFKPLPITRAIALDPWLEPLPTPGPAPWQVETSLDASPRPVPKLLLLNSEGFTLWEDHFAKLKELADIWKQPHPGSETDSEAEPRVRLLSLIRSKHMSFSDAGILFPPGLNLFSQSVSDSQVFLNVINDLSGSFLESGDDFARTLKGLRIRDEEIKQKKDIGKNNGMKWDKMFVGEAGDIIMHI